MVVLQTKKQSKATSWAEAVAQWVKRGPCKCEDPKNPYKISADVAAASTLSPRDRDRDFWGKLSG